MQIKEEQHALCVGTTVRQSPVGGCRIPGLSNKADGDVKLKIFPYKYEYFVFYLIVSDGTSVFLERLRRDLNSLLIQQQGIIRV